MPHKLMIHGDIGDQLSGLTSAQVIEKLDEIGVREELDVHINSYGGSVADGVAIYNALKTREGTTRVVVDGVAASSASLVAMAGDEIHMPVGSIMMLHNPWTITLGDAEEHRRAAEMLDVHAKSLVDIYAQKTGASRDDVISTMKDETWFSAEDAFAYGLCTHIESDEDEVHLAIALACAGKPERLQKLPKFIRPAVAAAFKPVGSSPAQPQVEEPTMDNEQKKPKTTEVLASGDSSGAADEAIKAVRAERKRISQISALCKRFDMVDLESEFIDSGEDIDAVRARVIDELSERQAPAPVSASAGLSVGTEERDKFIAAMENSLAARAGLAKLDKSNPYGHMSLKGISAMVAQRAGLAVAGMNDRQMVGQVLAHAGHSTSDFPMLLSGLVNRSLAEGYEEIPFTFEEWTRETTVQNFLPATRASLGHFSNLSLVHENAEYTYGTLGEQGAKIKVDTFGKLFAITRKAIINDDLNAFTVIPQLMGQAAKRTVNDAVLQILIDNPELADGEDLFSAAHNNIGTLELSAEGLSAARTALSNQRDQDGNIVYKRPGFLLVPPELEGTATSLLTAQNNLDLGPGVEAPNPVANMAKLIVEPRLSDMVSGTDYPWFVVDQLRSLIEVAYLNGESTPYLEQRAGWHVDGTEYKVRLDFGVAPIDYRGGYYSDGSTSI